LTGRLSHEISDTGAVFFDRVEDGRMKESARKEDIMGSDMFGGLGGLMKGLSGFMPQDNPDVKIMNAQTALEELKEKETKVYADIGRKALADSPGAYAEAEERLKLIQADMRDTLSTLDAAQSEKEASDREAQRADEMRTCPQCGTYNPEGVAFCQECGAKLGRETKCPSCCATVAPGVRFCGSCGTKVMD